MTDNDHLVLRALIKERGLGPVLRALATEIEAIELDGEHRISEVMSAAVETVSVVLAPIDGVEGSASPEDLRQITDSIRQLRAAGISDTAIQDRMENVGGVRERRRLTYGRAPKVTLSFKQWTAELDRRS
jgi:hypothetical protein